MNNFSIRGKLFAKIKAAYNYGTLERIVLPEIIKKIIKYLNEIFVRRQYIL